MKKIFITVLVSIAIHATAQITDSITMFPKNVVDVYYNFITQTKDSVSNTNWHLAFAVRKAQPPLNTMQAATISINDGLGVEVYKSNLTVANWTNFDTTGYKTWKQFYNSDSTWDIGAFNVERNKNNPFDYGWGEYNMTSRNVNGKNIWLLVLSSNPNNPLAPKFFKKLWVDKISYDTAWMFAIANIDGSDSTHVVIPKAAFNNKLFAYYNFITKQVLDREPNRPWDVVFTKYKSLVTLFGQTLMYPVVGVLHAPKLSVAKVIKPNAKDATPSDSNLTFLPNIANIGWDWKVITTTPGEWPIKDSLAYILKRGEFNYSKIVFSRYAASSTYQNITFNVTNYITTGISHTANNLAELSIYPNPATNHIAINLSNVLNANIVISDVTGKTIYNANNNFNTNQVVYVNTDNFNNGLYFVTVTSAGYTKTKRILISR